MAETNAASLARFANAFAATDDPERLVAETLREDLTALVGVHAASIRDTEGPLVAWDGGAPPEATPRYHDFGGFTLELRHGGSETPDAEELAAQLFPYAPWLSLLRERVRLLASSESIERLNRLAQVGERAADRAHELANLLQPIVAHAEMLIRHGHGQDVPAVARRILAAAVQCRKASRDLLGYVHSGEEPARAFRVLDAVLEGLELDGAAAEREIQVVFDDEDRGLSVEGDAGSLTQVFLNLIGNARHAVRDAADRTIVVSLTRARADGAQGSLPWGQDLARITVEDRGPGVPETLRDRIFERFFTTKPPTEGTGLGLGVSRQLMRRHEGDLWLDPDYTAGARFVIDLPSAPDVATEEEPEKASSPSAPRSRVLVVDDDRDMLETYDAILRLEGHECLAFERGQDALQFLASHPVDVILCDLRLPDLPGPQFLEALAQEVPPLVSRLVFATGDVASEEARTFLEHAGRPVLAKPFQMDDLQRIITQVLEGRETPPRA